MLPDRECAGDGSQRAGQRSRDRRRDDRRTALSVVQVLQRSLVATHAPAHTPTRAPTRVGFLSALNTTGGRKPNGRRVAEVVGVSVKRRTIPTVTYARTRACGLRPLRRPLPRRPLIAPTRGAHVAVDYRSGREALSTIPTAAGFHRSSPVSSRCRGRQTLWPISQRDPLSTGDYRACVSILISPG